MVLENHEKPSTWTHPNVTSIRVTMEKPPPLHLHSTKGVLKAVVDPNKKKDLVSPKLATSFLGNALDGSRKPSNQLPAQSTGSWLTCLKYGIPGDLHERNSSRTFTLCEVELTLSRNQACHGYSSHNQNAVGTESVPKLNGINDFSRISWQNHCTTRQQRTASGF